MHVIMRLNSLSLIRHVQKTLTFLCVPTLFRTIYDSVVHIFKLKFRARDAEELWAWLKLVYPVGGNIKTIFHIELSHTLFQFRLEFLFEFSSGLCIRSKTYERRNPEWRRRPTQGVSS